MKQNLWIVVFLLAGYSTNHRVGAQSLHFGSVEPRSTRAVLQVDLPNPTADKPQSKLWYMDRRWWAILPTASGPSLWERGKKGWVEKEEVRQPLAGIPGRADVWANGKVITAVSVESDKLVVFRLTRRKNLFFWNKWRTEILATLYPPLGEGKIETATIAQDKAGDWWIAADFEDKVCVWNADASADNWSDPFILSEGINPDDICLITVLPEGVGVIWSDQNAEAVRMRVHLDGARPKAWGEVITIEEGNLTADDHLNASLGSDGTLWVVSKNGLDIEGEPQFVLRVRSPEGEWRNFPYANMDPFNLPSRPIIVASEDSPIVVSAHSIYRSDNPHLGEIVYGIIDTTSTDILANITTIISPDTMGWVGKNRINDVTGPKMPFKKGIPWILLASDNEGRVYEAILTADH